MKIRIILFCIPVLCCLMNVAEARERLYLEQISVSENLPDQIKIRFPLSA